MSMTDHVLRRSKRLASRRFSPYTSGTNDQTEKQKAEAVELGVELSLFLAEAITYIKPKVGVAGVYDQPGGNSIQCHELITQDFAFLVKSLGRIVSYLKNGGVVKSCSFEKWFPKKLGESLRSAKHVSGTDGFPRETIKSKALPLWTSLFEAKPKRINPQSSLTSFPKLHPEPSSMTSTDISIISTNMESLWVTSCVLHDNESVIYSPCEFVFLLRTKISKEKQKEEAVRVGVEFSLFVAEAMFMLSDDVRSTLWFGRWLLSHACNHTRKQDLDDPVMGRLFCVFEYVFETYIKNKNGVYHETHKPIQWKRLVTFRQDFADGVREPRAEEARGQVEVCQG
ncbi:unnamed protein product [Arabis nemorensis]|uniref:Uncharacterized protein n=1 Tax=Arabis nemorensis TaxID=586526 RepID=A0A565AY20_9BRAS|nr:unnamed protein product [Arabis nemorensis]